MRQLESFWFCANSQSWGDLGADNRKSAVCVECLPCELDNEVTLWTVVQILCYNMHKWSSKNDITGVHTFCCELVFPVPPMAEVLVSRVVWLPAPVVPACCCTATVEIFWPSDVVMTTGTCIATRTVLLMKSKRVSKVSTYWWGKTPTFASAILHRKTLSSQSEDPRLSAGVSPWPTGVRDDSCMRLLGLTPIWCCWNCHYPRYPCSRCNTSCQCLVACGNRSMDHVCPVTPQDVGLLRGWQIARLQQYIWRGQHALIGWSLWANQIIRGGHVSLVIVDYDYVFGHLFELVN